MVLIWQYVICLFSLATTTHHLHLVAPVFKAMVYLCKYDSHFGELYNMLPASCLFQDQLFFTVLNGVTFGQETRLRVLTAALTSNCILLSVCCKVSCLIHMDHYGSVTIAPLNLNEQG